MRAPQWRFGVDRAGANHPTRRTRAACTRGRGTVGPHEMERADRVFVACLMIVVLPRLATRSYPSETKRHACRLPSRRTRVWPNRSRSVSPASRTHAVNVSLFLQPPSLHLSRPPPTPCPCPPPSPTSSATSRITATNARPPRATLQHAPRPRPRLTARPPHAVSFQSVPSVSPVPSRPVQSSSAHTHTPRIALPSLSTTHRHPNKPHHSKVNTNAPSPFPSPSLASSQSLLRDVARHSAIQSPSLSAQASSLHVRLSRSVRALPLSVRVPPVARGPSRLPSARPSARRSLSCRLRERRPAGSGRRGRRVPRPARRARGLRTRSRPV